MGSCWHTWCQPVLRAGRFHSRHGILTHQETSWWLNSSPVLTSAHTLQLIMSLGMLNSTQTNRYNAVIPPRRALCTADLLAQGGAAGPCWPTDCVCCTRPGLLAGLHQLLVPEGSSPHTALPHLYPAVHQEAPLSTSFLLDSRNDKHRCFLVIKLHVIAHMTKNEDTSLWTWSTQHAAGKPICGLLHAAQTRGAQHLKGCKIYLISIFLFFILFY